MRVIALETSGRTGSMAALHGDPDGNSQTVAESILTGNRRTAQSLLPELQQMLARCQWTPQSIGLVCVATGPGSFTGLRIGVTTAKTLAYATQADIAGVHTLAVLAAGVGAIDSPLWAILGAQRQELFAARFTHSGSDGQTSEVDTQIVGIDDWLKQLQPGEAVVGPPLAKLATRLPAGVEAVAEKLWQPSAVAVGQLGIRQLGARSHLQSDKADPMQLVPQYYRKSAAEEKAEQAPASNFQD